ncbi:MAG TPA: ornithine cyclodeaminase family protein [Thermoanaerobaculia bacterium]|nr:ornithine cyclodeaminase family protein [Thermoanaerobaculia bacterium]
MSEVLVLSAQDVRALLTIDECIAAVEDAFRARAIGPASLSLHVDGGAFHVKAAAIDKAFAVKVNGNFFDNPARGLPRIQGVVMFADATNGRPLAILDSIAITILRTGAATAVATKYLARRDARTLLICGCGLQGRISIESIRRVRDIGELLLFDVDRPRAESLARDSGGTVVDSIVPADIIVTCTPSRRAFLGDAPPGAFIAAVGADSSEKQELEPALMASSTVIVDDLAQCASFGDLRGAIAARAMTERDVRGTLADVVAGRITRRSDEEVVIFDSTGTALQDVAATAIVYARALALGVGVRVAL